MYFNQMVLLDGKTYHVDIKMVEFPHGKIISTWYPNLNGLDVKFDWGTYWTIVEE